LPGSLRGGPPCGGRDIDIVVTGTERGPTRERFDVILPVTGGKRRSFARWTTGATSWLMQQIKSAAVNNARGISTLTMTGWYARLNLGNPEGLQHADEAPISSDAKDEAATRIEGARSQGKTRN